MTKTKKRFIYISTFCAFILASSFSSAQKGEPLREFYADGKLRSEEPVLNGKRHGIGHYYHNNGVKYSEIPWKNGGKHGDFKLYRQDGTLEQWLTYKNGLRDGLLRWYTAKGELNTEEYYIKDKMHGPSRGFHENGNLKYEFNFENGVQQGQAKWFYEDGNIKAEAVFKNGKLHGPYKHFNKDGTVSSKAKYDRGKLAYTRYAKWGLVFLVCAVILVPFSTILFIIRILSGKRKSSGTILLSEDFDDPLNPTFEAELAGFPRRVAASLIDAGFTLLLLPLVFPLIKWSFQINSVLPMIIHTLFWNFLLIYLIVQYGGTPGKLLMNIRIVDQRGHFLSRERALLRLSPYLVIAIIHLLQMQQAVNSYSAPIEELTLIKVGLALEGTGGFFANLIFLSKVFFWVDIGTILLNDKKKAIHDYIAGSYVITKSSYHHLKEKQSETVQIAE